MSFLKYFLYGFGAVIAIRFIARLFRRKPQATPPLTEADFVSNEEIDKMYDDMIAKIQQAAKLAREPVVAAAQKKVKKLYADVLVPAGSVAHDNIVKLKKNL